MNKIGGLPGPTNPGKDLTQDISELSAQFVGGRIKETSLPEGFVTDVGVVADGAITPDKTDFIEYDATRNLLTGNALTDGKRILSHSAGIQDVATYTLSDYIAVDINTACNFSSDGVAKECFPSYFDATKAQIVLGEMIYAASFTTGATTAFVRLSFTTADVTLSKICMQKGSEILTVNLPTLTGIGCGDTREIVDLVMEIGAPQIGFKSKSAQHVNLLNCVNISEGHYPTSGGLSENANWNTDEDYTTVDPSTLYSVSTTKQDDYGEYISYVIASYTADKTFISADVHTTNETFTTPSNAAFIRIGTTSFAYDWKTLPLSTFFMEEVTDAYQVHCVNIEDSYNTIFPLTSLKAKKWGLFGDSITEKNFRSTANYHDYIRSETGIVTYNYAVGGSGYKNRDDNNNAFYQTALTNNAALSALDAITVMGGLNDCTREDFETITGAITDTFTVPGDMTGVTSNSVFACFKETIDLIQQYAPYTPLGIISPLPTSIYNPSDDTNNMSVFVTGCKEICRLRGIPYLDLYHTSGLRPWVTAVNDKLFICPAADSPDGIHPNYLGHEWIYPSIREFIKTLI